MSVEHVASSLWLFLCRGKDVCGHFFKEIAFFLVDGVPNVLQHIIPVSLSAAGTGIADLSEETFSNIVAAVGQWNKYAA